MKVLNGFLMLTTCASVVGLFAFKGGEQPAKKSSPEATVNYVKDDLKIDITYSRPYKKGREIFGGLVPFDEVWRTGANKATTFTTNKDLMIGGKKLSAGTYTLWTMPHADKWDVFFNKKKYNWGINMDGKASRDPEEDAVAVTVPVETLPEEMEQFTISVEDSKVPMLVLAWDKTKVAVPLQ